MSRFAILLAVSLWGATVSADPTAQRLAYVVSYQGLLSAGVTVDMADIQLEWAPQRASLSLSTHNFGAAEMVMPVRFCYRTAWQPDGQLRAADWWSRIGGKAARGQLQVDTDQRRVTRRHAERKLEQDGPVVGDSLAFSAPSRPAPKPDQDLDHAPFTLAGAPMGRLSMLHWVSTQALRPGLVLEPAVTNGEHLTGFRVLVEDEESIDWNGRPTPSYRLRLEPRYDDDSESEATWVWISRDARRLPLRFRGERAFGRFEARLVPPARAAAPVCYVPEAAELALPASG